MFYFTECFTVVLNRCDAFGHCTDDDNNEMLIKPSKLEVLVIVALIGTVTIVLLLVLCIVLLVIQSKRITGATVKHKFEQHKCGPVSSRAGIEDVQVEFFM